MTIPTVPPRMKLQPGDVVRHRTREQLLGDSYHSLDKFIEQGDLLVESVCDEGPRTRVAVKRVDVHGNPMEGLSGNDVWDSDRFYLLRPAGGFKPGDKIIHRPLREVPFLPFVGSQIDKIHVVDRVDTEQYVGIQRIFLKDMAGFLKDIAGSGSWAQQRFRLVERPEASSDGSAQPLNSEPADGIQVGSWVRVTKPTDPEESGRHWTPDMDRFNGRVFKVRLVGTLHDVGTRAYLQGAVINETDTVGFYFLRSWLAPVCKPRITDAFLPGDLVEVTTEGEAAGYPASQGKKNYVKAFGGTGVSCGAAGSADSRTGDPMTGWWGDPDSLKLIFAGDGKYVEPAPAKTVAAPLPAIPDLEERTGKKAIEAVVEERIKGLRDELHAQQRLTGQLSGYRTDHQTKIDELSKLMDHVNDRLKSIEQITRIINNLKERIDSVAHQAVSLSHVDQVEERLRTRDGELDNEVKRTHKRLGQHWELLTERLDRTNASLDRAHTKLTELAVERIGLDGRLGYAFLILCAIFSLALGLTINHLNGKITKALDKEVERRESF